MVVHILWHRNKYRLPSELRSGGRRVLCGGAIRLCTALFPQLLHEQVAVFLPIVPLVSSGCGQIAVLVAVALQIVAIGYHARVEGIGAPYHHPILSGRRGKLYPMLHLQLAVECAVCAGAGHGVHHGGKQSHIVKHVGVVGRDVNRLQCPYRESANGTCTLFGYGVVGAVLL